jgi:hypothetical protein
VVGKVPDMNDQLLKKRNVVAVLNELNRERLLYGAELVRRTDLTPATVSNLAAKQEKANAVDIGTNKVIAAVIDLHGNILNKERI